MTMDVFANLATIVLCVGAVIGVFVKTDKRITIVETRLEKKTDSDVLLEKLDRMRVAIENKIETEVQKIREEFRN